MYNISAEIKEHAGLVLVKKTSNPDLSVLKYHHKVFYQASWTPFLRECRGLIVDNEFNLAQYPFTKI